MQDECAFSQPLNSLPPNLKILTIHSKFNKPVGSLPSSLEHLTLLGGFKQSLDGLPCSLKSLRVGKLCHSALDGLPTGIKKLEVTVTPTSAFNDIPCQPEDVDITVLQGRYSLVLPLSTKVATIRGYYYGPPPTNTLQLLDAHSLAFSTKARATAFQHSVNSSALDQIVAPFHVQWKRGWTPEFFDLPICWYMYNNKGINILPDTITHVEFRSSVSSSHFDQEITKLPTSLTSLSFLGASDMNQPITLPASLTALRFGDPNPPFAPHGLESEKEIKYSHKMAFPPGVRELAIGSKFPLTECILPSSLAILVVPKGSDIPKIP
jgi:FNIP Repeat